MHCVRAAASRTFCTAGGQERDQNGNDCDNDEQLDEGESFVSPRCEPDHRRASHKRNEYESPPSLKPRPLKGTRAHQSVAGTLIRVS